MAILYAVVARTTVLAEFSAVTGNTGAVARRILEKLPSETESRLCFSQDRYIFHILRSEGISFLCMANDTFGRRIPFSYLEDIQMRFMKNYAKVASYAPAYAMNDEFSRVLHQYMEFYSSNPSADTLNRVEDRGPRGNAAWPHIKERGAHCLNLPTFQLSESRSRGPHKSVKRPRSLTADRENQTAAS
ncbi:PREDICTED: vesicle-associated membrane protein 714-like [Nicotiana attenuata]|uniref:vesicle-associated membrane protein 714-like n=1 Tax=Nicotiana attenuata TaxID=49451 RepID=UPI0009049365|nr:PREDICTED: vesicle-associated membrane protein 714-like [Nicotiana attenuata]